MHRRGRFCTVPRRLGETEATRPMPLRESSTSLATDTAVSPKTRRGGRKCGILWEAAPSSPGPPPSVPEPPADFVQISFIRFENGVQRTPLRNGLAEILPAYMKQSSLILTFVAGQRAEIPIKLPIFGRRAMKVQLTRHEDDAEPSFA